MNKSLFYKDVILKHGKCSVKSRSECDISVPIANKVASSPVIPSNMPAIMNFEIAQIFDKNGWFHIFPRNEGVSSVADYVIKSNELGNNFISISIGVSDDWLDLLKKLKESKYRIDSITIDVAFSWNDKIIPLIRHIKKEYSTTELIVGNGDSPEWIKWLENLGVGIAKIFLGTSAACRTKEFTGFASTTITDLERCAEAAKNIKIMADGGLTILPDGDIAIGDVAKAIRFGADFILSGALFSKCLDSPSLIDGYYGNSTEKAKKHSNHVEGAVLKVQTNGRTIRQQMKLVEDSLKSSVSYSGGNKLSDLRFVDYQVV